MDEQRAVGAVGVAVAVAEARAIWPLLVGTTWVTLAVLVTADHLEEVPGALAAYAAAAYVVRR